jgi:hypothetical protein
MLTGKQRKFVDTYLGRANGNASEAARIAGYGSPGEAGYAALKNTQVRAAIDAALAADAMTAKETLWRLTRIARGDIGDFISLDAKGSPTVNLKAARRAGKLGLVKAVRQTKHGVWIELHDPLAALDKLARYHRLCEAQEPEAVNVFEAAMERLRARRAEREAMEAGG